MKNIPYNIVDTLLIPHGAFDHATKHIDQYYRAVKKGADPIVIPLVGESRTGKSSLLAYTEQLHPRRRLADGMQVPVLRIRTPSKPTVKGLAEQLLLALGDPRFNQHESEIEKTNRLLKLLNGCGTRMVMIDEFQHFYDKGTHRIMHHVSDWLKILSDESQLAMVVSGLPSCLTVLSQNEQLAGRCMATLTMPRFSWTDDVQREQFISVLEAFQQGLHMFDLPDMGSDEIAFRFYIATGGLMGYLAKILRQVTWNALDAEDPMIRLDDLSRAFRSAVLTRGAILVDPFTTEFDSMPSEELIQQALTLGIADSEGDEKSRHQRRKFGPSLSANEAMKA